MSIGENIKKIRKERNLTQKELGEKLGISQAAIGQFESNSSNLKADTIKKIADALDVTMVELCEGSINEYKDILINFNLGGIPDILNDYTQELGEFLYHNPNHKALFDASMEVKPNDVVFAKQMLDRINGKVAPTED